MHLERYLVDLTKILWDQSKNFLIKHLTSLAYLTKEFLLFKEMWFLWLGFIWLENIFQAIQLHFVWFNQTF